jgi:hypothetical protein
MMSDQQALVLHRRTRMTSPVSLHCREIELSVGEDGRHVTLSRYVELYGDESSAWCSVQHHRVPLASMIRWMISHGERTEV